MVAETRDFIVNQAQERLHSTRGAYVDAVKHFPVDADTWIVSLDAHMVWREEGMPQHSMIDDLLKGGKGLHTAKDGSTWKTIPFEQNKAPTTQTFAQQNLTAS